MHHEVLREARQKKALPTIFYCVYPEKTMPRTPAFPPKIFHRIRPTSLPALNAMIVARSTAIVSPSLVAPFKRGHGLIVASWDGVSPAEVHALGVVVDIDVDEKREIEWKAIRFNLPLRQDLRGAQFWKQPTFKFAATVAESFGLKKFFEKYMTDPFNKPA